MPTLKDMISANVDGKVRFTESVNQALKVVPFTIHTGLRVTPFELHLSTEPSIELIDAVKDNKSYLPHLPKLNFSVAKTYSGLYGL